MVQLFITSLLLLIAIPAQAGWVIFQSSKDVSNQRAIQFKTVSYLQSDKWRMDVDGESLGIFVIFDGKEFHGCQKEQKYCSKGLMALNGVSPSIQSRITRFDFKSTGKTQQVAGQPCEIASVEMEIEMNTFGRKSVSKHFTNACFATSLDSEAFNKAHSIYMNHVSQMFANKTIAENFLKFKLFRLPLDGTTKSHIGGEVSETRTTTERIEKKNLPSDLFKIPSGYKVINARDIATKSNPQMQEAMKNMQEAMKNLTPAQREQMKKMMPN